MRETGQTRVATIYQFPKGGRSGFQGAGPFAPSLVSTHRFAPNIIAEGGWYHDEAMREEAEEAAMDGKRN